MHDPTEGALAGGLHELADASRVGVKVWEEAIPIMPETAEICRLLAVNPLALIASGSLLVVAEDNYAEYILRRLKRRRIQASIIGETIDGGQRLLVRRNGRVEKLLRPKQDELWKAIERAKTL